MNNFIVTGFAILTKYGGLLLCIMQKKRVKKEVRALVCKTAKNCAMTNGFIWGFPQQNKNMNLNAKKDRWMHVRSEERRVGKECRL